jgi:hypothetical protein
MKLAAGFAAVTAASFVAMYFGISSLTRAGQPEAAEAAAHFVHQSSPSAAEFAGDLAGTANQYGTEHAAGARLARTHCVQPASGRYMCSFAVVYDDGTSECHLIQARWTPDSASTITVTLAGRVARCGTLREAIKSMG